MLRKRTIPLILLILWLAIVSWQVLEHKRFQNAARNMLISRARDISNTLAVVIRSQRLFGGVVFQPRLESALYDLVDSRQLISITLLNANGEVVTSIGRELDRQINDLSQEGEKWGEDSVTFINLVDLGIDPRRESASSPTIILSDEDREKIMRRGRPRPPRRSREDISDATPGTIPYAATGTLSHGSQPPRYAGRGRGRPRFGRPPGMSEEEYQSLLNRSGLHGFAVEVSTDSYNRACQRDLWIRLSITGFATLGFFGVWLAWRNLLKSSQLQVRLVRASEMNAHLREMNLAAAGLAHETRNPLNVVRGLAQIIQKAADAPPNLAEKATKITDEVDRVTAQLNEFIDYSKPCEPKPAPVLLRSIIQDVERALQMDLEDQSITFRLQIEDWTVEADEALLRQVVFNLLLNAVQSVPQNGCIELSTGRDPHGTYYLEIQDNGPGIPEENRDKIFRPYFTTREEGTGLGLAVVQQIALAHGWEIKYIASEAQGAKFRITGLHVISTVV